MRWLALLVVLVPAVAQAHQPSRAQLRLERQADGLHGRLDLALRDLDVVVPLDGNHDGDVTFAEVRAAGPHIAAYVTSHLDLGADGARCPVEVSPPGELAGHVDGLHGVIRLHAACIPRERLHVDYRVLVDVDAQHRGLLAFTQDGHTQTALLAGPTVVAIRGASSTLAAFVGEGIWHIWIGFDHILFLLALLLPAVVGQQERLRDVFAEVLEIVTAFTLAHSITLILAALDLVRLPSRVVETAIAISVALAALNNLVRAIEARWAVAFALGTLHGFGFSSVLLDLGLPAGTLVPALLGFNLGVELGQAAIVVAFLPLAFLVRRTLAYRVVLYAGSAAIVAVALRWSVERLAA